MTELRSSRCGSGADQGLDVEIHARLATLGDGDGECHIFTLFHRERAFFFRGFGQLREASSGFGNQLVITRNSARISAVLAL